MEWIKNHVVELTEAIRQLILVGVLFQLLAWTDQQIAGVLMAVSAVLALFTRSNTITVNQLDQRVTERVAQRDAGLPGPSGTGMGTRIPTILLCVALAGAMYACATSVKQKAVAGYQSAHTALTSFQDTEEALYNAKTIPSLTEENQVKFAKILSTAYDIEIKAGDALKLWRTGEPVPNEVTAWMNEGSRVINELRAMFPEDDRIKIAQAIVPWVRAMVDTLKLLGIIPSPTLTRVVAEGKV